jgi:hypothetical protein
MRSGFLSSIVVVNVAQNLDSLKGQSTSANNRSQYFFHVWRSNELHSEPISALPEHFS